MIKIEKVGSVIENLTALFLNQNKKSNNIPI